MKPLPEGFEVKDQTELGSSGITPTEQKFLEALNRIPDSQLMTNDQVLEFSGVSRWVTSHTTRQPFLNYRYLHGQRLLWGNKQTIARLRKKMQPES